MPKRSTSLRVGLTGGFGSGKSTALQFFREAGAFTLDADRIVHDLMKNDRGLRSAIRRKFGTLDRAVLAQKVFTSPAHRRALEGMIHPRVRARMTWALARNKKPIAVCDVPLLFEAGWSKRFTPIIVITAPLAKRIARLKKKGFAVKDIKARLASQWPLEKKVKHADIVIRNTGSIRDVRRQVQKIYQSLVHKHVEDV